MKKSRSYIAIPPGATIKEQLIDRGMSQKEFAVRMGMTEKHISKLVNGEVQLTIDVARRLEMVLGLPAQFWCNLESIYREKIAKVHEENTMDEDVEFAEKFPYKAMAQNGWVEETSSKTEQAIRLRKFFEIIQLSMLKEHFVPDEIVSKRSTETEKKYYALVAWAQKAKLEARKIQTQTLKIKALERIMLDIKKMSVVSSDDTYLRLQSMLADCGIAVVFLPHIGEPSLQGLTFHDGNKIILGITVVGKETEQFWDSLFHGLKNIISDYKGNSDDTGNREEISQKETV